MNSEEKEYKKLKPLNLSVLQNFPFIDADFDALTYYELLCKVVEYLNDTMYDVDVLNVSFQDLKKEVDSAIDYMETNLPLIVGNLFEEYIEEGRINVSLVETYNDETESLVLSVRMEENNG